MNIAMSSKEEMARKRALRDILAYEDTLTVDVEKTIQTIRARVKLLHTELDRYINKLLSDIKKKFDQELNRIRQAVERLNGDSSPRKQTSSRTEPHDRTQQYRSTPRSSNTNFTLNVSQLSDIPRADSDDVIHFDKKELNFFEGETSDALFKKLAGHYTFELTTSITFSVMQRATVAKRRSEVKLVKSFRVGDKSETVHAIAPVGEDQAWVCCGWGSRNLALYDKNGQKKKSTTLDIQVYQTMFEY